MDEKTLAALGTLGTIILGVLAAAIAWFAGGQNLQGNTKEVLRQMFNFEICLLIVGIVVGFIPVVNMIGGLVIFVVNIIFALKAFSAANNGTEFKAPALEIIK